MLGHISPPFRTGCAFAERASNAQDSGWALSNYYGSVFCRIPETEHMPGLEA